MWSGDIPHSRWGCDSAPCSLPGHGQTRPRATKITHLRIQIRQIYTPSRSLVGIPLGSADEQTTGWDDYLGTAGINSFAKIHVLTIASPSFLLHHHQILSSWLPQISLRGEIRVGAPTKQPTMLGVSGCPFWVLLSHWRNQKLRGDLSR